MPRINWKNTELWFSRHIYHSGFIVDLAIGVLAFFVTPWIPAQTENEMTIRRPMTGKGSS